MLHIFDKNAIILFCFEMDLVSIFAQRYRKFIINTKNHE